MIPNDPVKHVIVLMLENRSFDHILGGLDINDLNGINKIGPQANMDVDGKSYRQAPGAARFLPYDPKHELEHVICQLAGNNSGFVDDFSRAYPLSTEVDRAEIMKYHADGALPALHALAKNFAICDNWYSSLPGPTWPNRFFVHSGTSLGRASMPEGILDANLHWYNQTTIYDRLNQAKRSWKIYYGDIPQSLMLAHQLEPENLKQFFKLSQFFNDVTDEATFPEYSFIEPPYYEPGAADYHPPHDILEGERLVANIYNAIRGNPALWKSCLLVVVFDEHGGFYDHVSPPTAKAPDTNTDEYHFDRLGVRVPAILISPFVKTGVIHTQLEHASLLKYLTSKWDLGPLGGRVFAADSFVNNILSTEEPDRLPVIPEVTAPDGLEAPSYGKIGNRPQPSLNGHQSALVGLTQLLEAMTDVGGDALLGRAKRLITGYDGVVDVAIERVEHFFAKHRSS
jgi:phospholipase C